MEAIRQSKRLIKPNTRYSDIYFNNSKKQIEKKKTSSSVKQNGAKRKPIAPKPPSNEIKRSADAVPKITSVIQKPISAKAKAAPAEKATNVSTNTSRTVKKSKYSIDLTGIADSVCVSNFSKFLLDHLLIAHKPDRQINVLHRKLIVRVKSQMFLKKEDVRVIIKKYLKTLQIVHLTKVTSTSKSGYKVIRKPLSS